MKHFLENSKTFEAQAVIDCCYFLFEKLTRKLGKPQPPLVMAIDEATGFGKAQTEKARLDAIDLLEQIIKNKKFMEADYSGDEKMLAQLQELTVE